ncbi:MAG: hypothetical protein ACYCV4_07330 [Dermatophilaceae bacterium]
MVSGDQHESAFWRAEAERLAAENEILRARVLDLETQVAALSEKVAALAKLAFGEKSEKSKAKKAPPGATSAEDGTGAGSTQRRRGQQPGSRGHGRRDYSHLETEEEIHDVAEEDRCCPQCGAQYAPFGEETSAQID